LLCERVVVAGWTLTEAAEAAEVSVRCARKWVGRYRAEGEAGLLDRSSAPAVVANRTDERRIEVIAALRRLRFTGPEIAELLDMALSTVSGILTRIGMGRLGRLGLEPAARYERAPPGRIGPHRRQEARQDHRPRPSDHRQPPPERAANDLHARRAPGRRRGLGVRAHRHRRLHAPGLCEVLPDEKATTAIAFLRRAVGFFERHAITVQQLLTDNGSAYRSAIHAIACRALGVRHLRTRPRRPQTNGKAERFIRTMLAGWAYGALYRNSQERTQALDAWLWHYNHRRRHSALGHHPPITRVTNLLGLTPSRRARRRPRRAVRAHACSPPAPPRAAPRADAGDRDEHPARLADGSVSPRATADAIAVTAGTTSRSAASSARGAPAQHVDEDQQALTPIPTRASPPRARAGRRGRSALRAPRPRARRTARSRARAPGAIGTASGGLYASSFGAQPGDDADEDDGGHEREQEALGRSTARTGGARSSWAEQDVAAACTPEARPRRHVAGPGGRAMSGTSKPRARRRHGGHPLLEQEALDELGLGRVASSGDAHELALGELRL
jgi:transposase InsO family protein/transposase